MPVNAADNAATLVERVLLHDGCEAIAHSQGELAQPAPAALVPEGSPCYATPFGTDAVWNLPEPPLPISVLRMATRPRARA